MKTVLDKDLTAPPTKPVVGDAYLVPAGGSSAWAGHAGEIATWNGAAWVFTLLADGTAILVADEERIYVYTGGQWTLLLFNGIPATIVGTPGDDLNLVGTPNADVIHGLGGNDTIFGLDGDDTICGGAGNDKLRGGKGKDQLFGEEGKDKLYGGPQGDRLHGGTGRDYCDGGPGRDKFKRCEKKVSAP